MIDEFNTQMRIIAEKYSDDPESSHYWMDKLMCETLRKLGFDEGIDIFEESARWYS